MSELEQAWDETEVRREEAIDVLTAEELTALGSIVTIESAGPDFELRLESLQSFSSHRTADRKRPLWLLLSVTPRNPGLGLPDVAVVWVSDEYRERFMRLFEQYLDVTRASGAPANNQLIANIGRIRSSVLRDLWQSDGEPPTEGKHWWEVWLHAGPAAAEMLTRYAEARGLSTSGRLLMLNERVVTWIYGEWESLQLLPSTAVPVAELRRPSFVDTIEDASPTERDDLVQDLAIRASAAPTDAPAVCHLDTGVARTHVLLEPSLSPDDLHTVIGTNGFDQVGHGTAMAGLALYGDLDDALTNGQAVLLEHRLESVRILPTAAESAHNPLAYGDVTAQAVALPEITSPRRRVFCMPISATGDVASNPGQPTLWSATIDALTAGGDVVSENGQLNLLSPATSAASRLMIVSAGNVDLPYAVDHLTHSDLHAVEDPGQAWNALTVGAHTDRVDLPSDPHYSGWSSVAPSGELSPYSRTSLLYGPAWPVKPDICMEGGNLLHDGGGLFEGHPITSVRTTGHADDAAIRSAHATSAATAQAARLAAKAMALYPKYWPETIRGLMVHGAEWTESMRAQLRSAGGGKKDRLQMLRRYGWGVPTEARVLYSSEQAATLVIQDEFVPFDGPKFAVPHFRLHELPWPNEALAELGDAKVTLRVTLSYFVEPAPSRRGWRRRYSYPSHGLRFEIRGPLESQTDFIKRINRDAVDDGEDRPSGSHVKWYVGPQQRHRGSLHQDAWLTSGTELAQSKHLAVYPVGGWWKNNRTASRIDQLIRYSLVVSLKTREEGVDLYTPIQNELTLPVATPIAGS